MKLCIIDPAMQIPGLKLLFPEAEYYGHEPDDFFNFTPGKNYTREDMMKENGFEYRVDWETINDKNYEYLFISVPLKDFFSSLNQKFGEMTKKMRDKIKEILNKNKFKSVVLFDTYDYDYDPNLINNEWKIDYYFKRNYNKNINYQTNVFPFPYIMFVKPCILSMIINNENKFDKYKINKALWVGNLYNHIDKSNNVNRNRLDMYNEIKNDLDTLKLSENNFKEAIKNYKITVDLIGVGDPNKRTIEILTNGGLMLSMCSDLVWGFENEDNFHKDTFFKTSSEFKEKLNKLLNNEEHYLECLNQQYKIVKKYFNKRWLREYIEEKIQYNNKNTVCLFLTSCNRPKLLKTTLESFVKYNTYPIEYGIILEDSGLSKINDFAYSIVPFPLKIIYNKKRIGQMKSIENGIQYINTKYIFHCEEDWEFYDYSFIEKSMEILKKNNYITSVWLRSHNEIKTLYKMPINKKDDYYLVGPNIGNFSWNPGLKTFEIQNMFVPYSSNHELVTICEGGLDKAFRKLGMTSAMTNNLNGYVKHIGWNHHVW
jgi:hypothetical protein